MELSYERMLKTHYDFERENILLRVLGGFTILKSSKPITILNMFCFMLVYCLFLATFAMSIITTYVASEQKAVMGQALFTVGTLCVGIGLTSAKHVRRKDLEKAAKIIRNHLFLYDEKLDEDYLEIKMQRVEEMRFAISFFINMFLSCGFGYAVIFPILKLFFVNEGPVNEYINDFLPIPLYFPFKTNSLLNYSLIYIANGITLTCMYASYASHLQIYVTCALQLTAEYEILNYSLENMERRAFLELWNVRVENLKEKKKLKMYEKLEFQECLLACLRKNVLHHLAIQEFTKIVGPYMEVTNSIGILLFSILMALSIVIVLEDPTRNVLLTMTLFGTLFGYLPMCWFGELMTATSERTFLSFYSTPWPYCNKKFRSILKIAVTNTVQPLILRATGIKVKVSLETFGELMSGGYKVANLLR